MDASDCGGPSAAEWVVQGLLALPSLLPGAGPVESTTEPEIAGGLEDLLGAASGTTEAAPAAAANAGATRFQSEGPPSLVIDASKMPSIARNVEAALAERQTRDPVPGDRSGPYPSKPCGGLRRILWSRQPR